MNIDKIIKMKDNKYKIIIDGENLITYDNVILNYNLLYKKTIEKDLYDLIIKETNFYSVYNKVLKFSTKKIRSEKEITYYLTKQGIDDFSKNKIINKLKDINVINDKEYAKAYINDQIYLSDSGINKIKINLLNENISEDVISLLINDIDSSIINSKLEKLVIKKLNSNKKYSNNHIKQKIINEMVIKGYNKSDIINIIDKNLVEDKTIINKEFNKIYNKLSLKYSNEELKNKVRQKLIYKGFNLNDINNLLQNKTEE